MRSDRRLLPLATTVVPLIASLFLTDATPLRAQPPVPSLPQSLETRRRARRPVYMSVAQRDSQRVAQDSTRPLFRFRGLHLDMTLADVRELIEVPYPLANLCQESTLGQELTLRCHLSGQFRSDGARVELAVSIAGMDTTALVKVYQLRMPFPSLPGAVAALARVASSWEALRPAKLGVRQDYGEEPEPCRVRVEIMEDDLAADAYIDCFDLVRRTGPALLKVSVIERPFRRP